MFDEIKKELSSIKLLSILLTLAVGMYLLTFVWKILGNFSDIIIILILSWLISFILEPIAKKINSFTKLSLTLSTIITYLFTALLLTIVIILFIPVVSKQFETLSLMLPKYLETSPDFVKKWNDNLLSSLYNYISYIPSVANFLFSIVIILILSFYFIIDKEKISKEIIDLVPDKWHEDLRHIRRITNQTFSSFIQVQLLFGVVNGIATWLVLRILGIDFAASVGLLAGFFGAIPVIGPYFALIPPVFISLVEDPAKTIIILILILVIQQLIYNIWGPKLLGKTFRIHPVIVLLSFLVGFKIAGATGAIFAIPVISIISIIIRELGHLYKIPKEKRQ